MKPKIGRKKKTNARCSKLWTL